MKWSPTEVAWNGAVTGLATCAFAGETAFADETLKEIADAVGREEKIKGIADVPMRNRIVNCKEGGKTTLYVRFFHVKGLAIRNLAHLEVPNTLEQVAVRLENDASYMDVLAAVIAFSDFNVALQRKAESTNPGQVHSVAFLHLVKHHALGFVESMSQLTRRDGRQKAVLTLLEINDINGGALF